MLDIEQVYTFAVRWLNKFRDPNINIEELEDHIMANDCNSLGFIMDCGNAFSKKYGQAFSDYTELSKIIDDVNDIKLLVSAIYSRWRYFNRWAYSGEEILKRENLSWFILALDRLATLA